MLPVPEPGAKQPQPSPEESAEEGVGQLFTLALDAIGVSDVRLSFTDYFQAPEGEAVAPEDLVTLAAYTVKGITLDMEKQRLDIAEVALADTALTVKRQRDDLFNVLALAPPGVVAAGEPPSGAEAPVPSEEEEAPPETEKTGYTPPWIAHLDRFSVTNLRLDATDLAPGGGGDFRVSDLNFTATRITNEKKVPADFDLSLKVNESASMATRGKVVTYPFDLTLAYQLDGMNLAWFQPFAKEFVTVILADGNMSADCRIEASMTPEAGLTATVKGDVGLPTSKSWRRTVPRGWCPGKSCPSPASMPSTTPPVPPSARSPWSSQPAQYT
jgi:hypothetical protein